jgi:hypothetical protein
MAYLVPADPNEMRQRRRVPTEPVGPDLRERDAVVLKPANGWELVDTTLANAAQGRPIPAPVARAPHLPRVHQLWRLGTNVVRPVATAG